MGFAQFLKFIASAIAVCSILGFANQVPAPKDSGHLDDAPTSGWEEANPTAREIASVEFPILTHAQVKKMSAQNVYRYYKQLHLLMAEMEKFQRLDKKSDKFSQLLQHIMINESSANTESLPPYHVGTDCLIGGYWGKWTYRKNIPGIANKNGMTCISENRCSLPGDSADSPSGHKCNPKYFTYENASQRQDWCVNLKKDLTTNGCITLLEKRYSEMCDSHQEHCRPFADHFKRSILQAISADAKYQGISEQEAMNQYKTEVFTEFGRIRNYCGDTKAEWDRHSAGQQYSCFNLMQQYEQLQETVKEIAPTYTPPAKPVSTDGLGPYACVRQGLINAGYPNASNRQIAMFAVRAKDQADDTFIVSLLSGRDARRKMTLENTILSVSSVGVCQGQYLTADDTLKTNYWLNRDKLSDLNNSEYKRVFGVENTRVIPRGGWRNFTFSQRRSSWDNRVNNSSVRSCPQKPQESESKRLCRAMSKACGLAESDCEYIPPKERDGGRDSGNNSSGIGGSTSGTSGSTSGNAETGPGTNEGSGHGNDNGGGHGHGPG